MSAVTLKQASSPLERYRAEFEARRRPDDALSALRRAALEKFLARGLPGPRDEDWKYTSLRRFESREFALADASSLALEAGQSQWIQSAGTRVVLVNGHAMPTLASQAAQPPGMTLLTLAQWAGHDPSQVAEFLAKWAGEQASPFEQLNLAFFEDGVVLELAADARPDEPLYVVHQWNQAGQQRMSHPRLIVRAGPNSRCTIIEHYLGPADIESFTNAVTTVELADGASVQHYRIQQESTRSFHIGHVGVSLERDSRYSLHDIALGAGLARVGISTRLAGSGSHVSLQGLLAPAGTQHLDSHTRIDHLVPHTTSNEAYRGIASDRGRGVFNGKVIVHPHAQKTDARQSSRNLLLSPGAEIDAKPELEIYADDVKCSHGATTGQLDANALFYLRSRGLSESEARKALIHAFAESILATIELDAVRSHLDRLLETRYGSATEAAR
ncbi:MAG TPA: Fe-S cluster assembly protein SufD [Steroidobacteraceae bacterium]